MKRMKDAETAAASAAPAPPPTSEDKPNPADDTLSPTDEKLKERLNTFLNRALDGGQADKNLMDNFNRFGVSLFVAGASEILTSQGEIEPKSQIKILADCLLLLKFKKSHALSLSERYEEYLLADSRYMQMFQAGRGAISVFLDDATAAPRLLDEALSEWNKPKAVRQESGPVTVMFANMIRPPVRPGAEGEEKAERLIQLHSRIVGEALAAHSGMEVKRVTNGIMATFATAADAVVAGADMQKNATASKQSDPSLLLQMRIGINAGQPSPEEADLYGTVVRLSAQIGEKAPAERIYVSEQVSVFCDGMGFTFLDHGSVELPGSEEPVKIFEVHWRAINTETTPAAEPRVSENA
ncbi:MAG: adenylate/guanylate cyclase domain-containing protein [Rhodospirillales bacterium]|nr:adenylate/guanylate cyclase domain-containing protein [Rhodospirillales bacterium]